jgi:hypothetical protein
MSQAFVKENDEQLLHDVSPTLPALINYLTRENNGIRVYEIRETINNSNAREVYHMSNILAYTRNERGRWEIA